MEPESRAIVFDAFAIGRRARGERLAFTELVSRIAITRQGRPILLDRISLDPSRRIPEGLGTMEGFGYLASIAIFTREW